MYCPDCGHKNDEDAGFCEHCGKKLGPGVGNRPPYKKKRGNFIIAALAAVICIGIAGILLYLLVLSPEKENRMFTADAAEQETFDVDETREKEGEAEESSVSEKDSFLNTPTSTPATTPTETVTPSLTPVPTKISTPVPDTEETTTPVPEARAADSEYIIPDSSSRILSRSEIESLSDEKLRLAINEIYARHGRKFQSEELQNYFNGKSWYHPSIEAEEFQESMLNETERQNILVMVEVQHSRLQ